jgi:hypothetical protein
MATVHSLLFLLRASLRLEDRLLQRMEVIRGCRLDWSDPTVSVFSRRRVAAVPR